MCEKYLNLSSSGQGDWYRTDVFVSSKLIKLNFMFYLILILQKIIDLCKLGTHLSQMLTILG